VLKNTSSCIVPELQPNNPNTGDRLSALAQLVRLLILNNITDLSSATGYSDRMVRRAKVELKEAGFDPDKADTRVRSVRTPVSAETDARVRKSKTSPARTRAVSAPTHATKESPSEILSLDLNNKTSTTLAESLAEEFFTIAGSNSNLQAIRSRIQSLIGEFGETKIRTASAEVFSANIVGRLKVPPLQALRSFAGNVRNGGHTGLIDIHCTDLHPDTQAEIADLQRQEAARLQEAMVD